MKMRFPLYLSDSHWQCISSFLPVKTKGVHCLRSIVTALFYVAQTSCQWRNLPGHFPPWPTVYYHFRRLNSIGLFSKLVCRLRILLRVQANKKIQPSAAVIDSQSVRTGPGVSKAKGWDGAKKLLGRKRHLVTDTLGLPLAIHVTSAAVSDREGMAVMAPYLDRAYSLKTLFADSGYRGMHITEARLAIVNRGDVSSRWKKAKRLAKRTFEPVPKRWVVERSLGWLTHYRRLARDYEKRVDCSIAMIKIAFIAIMSKRLSNSF